MILIQAVKSTLVLRRWYKEAHRRLIFWLMFSIGTALNSSAIDSVFTNNSPSQIPGRDLFEVLYFLSSVVLAIAACVGLYQLVLTKRSTQTNAKREGVRLAAEQCEIYLSKIIPLQDELLSTLERLKVVFPETTITIEGKQLRYQFKPLKLTSEQAEEVALPTLRVYNAMEAFAVNFTSGLADERVAFGTVGRTFCDSVRNYAPEIVFLHQDGYFQNILRLFNIWHRRVVKQELAEQRRSLQTKADKIDDVSINVLGTE